MSSRRVDAAAWGELVLPGGHLRPVPVRRRTWELFVSSLLSAAGALTARGNPRGLPS